MRVPAQRATDLIALLLLVITAVTSQTTNSSNNGSSFTPFQLWTSEEIRNILFDFQAKYPDLINVTTSQEKFGLPVAGGDPAEDCAFETNAIGGCLNYYAVVEDKLMHPPASATWKTLPTVLLSGALHGNERVGPTTVLETTRVLLEAANCEALPRFTSRNNRTQWQLEMDESVECRVSLRANYNMSDNQRKWLARLVSTRRIIVIPTANARGYSKNIRSEAFALDPNRDFPYDQLDGRDCMNTIAARTLNELYRYYLVTNSFTFHAGTELLGYEWGNPSHFGSVSPDDIAQDQLAKAYREYGGGFTGIDGESHPAYEYGDMNSIIYFVRGGFEDFAYAGSWDHDRIIPCNPTTYGGYPEAKTIYDDGMLRSFNMLVETSWRKRPADDDLGTTWNFLNANSLGTNSIINNSSSNNNNNNNNNVVTTIGDGDEKGRRQLNPNLRSSSSGSRDDQQKVVRLPVLAAVDRQANGHVPRNMRLALASIDMVAPYVRMTHVNDVPLPDDVVPMTPHLTASDGFPGCSNRRLLLTTGSQSTVDMRWTVGGAMSVDETQLWYTTVTISSTNSSDASRAEFLNYLCKLPSKSFDTLTLNTTDPSNGPFQPTGPTQSGKGFFVTDQDSSSAGSSELGPSFTTPLDLNKLVLNVPTPPSVSQSQTYLIVVATAKVDKSWSDLPIDAPVAPVGMRPQSHMVESRRNPSWFFKNAQGYVIQGQEYFVSEQLILQLFVGDANATANTRDSSAAPQLTYDRRREPGELIAKDEKTGNTSLP